MFKTLKTKALAASALALTAGSAFAEVDPAITTGMAAVETQVQEIGAAGLPVIIAIGIFGIGVGIVVGLLRRGARAV